MQVACLDLPEQDVELWHVSLCPEAHSCKRVFKKLVILELQVKFRAFVLTPVWGEGEEHLVLGAGFALGQDCCLSRARAACTEAGGAVTTINESF